MSLASSAVIDLKKLVDLVDLARILLSKQVAFAKTDLSKYSLRFSSFAALAVAKSLERDSKVGLNPALKHVFRYSFFISAIAEMNDARCFCDCLSFNALVKAKYTDSKSTGISGAEFLFA